MRKSAFLLILLAGCGENIVGEVPAELLRDGGFRDAGPVDAAVVGNPYPAGPYGGMAGDIIANAQFQGYVVEQPMNDIASTGYRESVTMDDLRNIDGYKFLMLNVAADWCAECKLEAREFPHQYENWAPDGGLLVSVVIEDINTLPATRPVLDNWVGAQSPNYTTLHDVTGFINNTFAPSTLPMNAVIDLRTMEILRVQIGTDLTIFRFFEAKLAE